jgi:hypothetical protein
MLRHIITAIVIAIIAIVGGAYLLPQIVHVERSTVIERPAATIFPYINSLKRANEWSPWTDIDPNVKITYSGAEFGVGSKMSWSGNDKVGSGTEVITQSVWNRKIAVDLDFVGQGGCKAALTLTTQDHGTQVLWSVDVNVGNNPIGRYMGLTIDKAIGADYERGLAKLKALVEKAPEAPAQPASAPATESKAATS